MIFKFAAKVIFSRRIKIGDWALIPQLCAPFDETYTGHIPIAE
jgi:hypothetical protein